MNANPGKENKHSIILLFSFALLFLLLQGCASFNPYPLAARAGDTIMLPAGTPDGMTKANTSVTFTPIDSFGVLGTPVDITANVRAITKIYPEKTSSTWLFSDEYGLTLKAMMDYSGHAPWQSIIVVDLPPSPIISEGAGEIQVTTSAVYSSVASLQPFKITILPGTGESNLFKYWAGGLAIGGNLATLEPLPQVVVKPAPFLGGIGTVPTYGAVEVNLNIPMRQADCQPIPGNSVRVVADDLAYKDLESQRQVSWVRNGDNITVNFISPNGNMSLYELRFSVVVRPGNIYLNTSGPSLTSIKYYDVDGIEVIGSGDPTVFLEHTTGSSAC